MVRVVLPDGTALSVEDPDLDVQLSKLLGRQVSVSAAVPEHGRLERAVPEYEGGVPDAVRESASVDATGESITSGSVAPGTFFDFGRVHLVTTSALARMRTVHPTGDFDARRFRPNLVVDTHGGPGFPEDAWVGSRLRVGEALFRVVVPTPRCVVPTLGHGELPPDPAIMRAVAREHRIPVFDLGGFRASACTWTSLKRGRSEWATRSPCRRPRDHLPGTQRVPGWTSLKRRRAPVLWADWRRRAAIGRAGVRMGAVARWGNRASALARLTA